MSETQGSIDNQLRFMQLCNAAAIGISAASNNQDVGSIQLGMTTINNLSAYLSTQPTSLNPNALAVYTVLNATLSGQYGETVPNNATTLVGLCNPGSNLTSLTNVVTYFQNTGCMDLTNTTFPLQTFGNVSVLSLLQAIPSAYKDWCNADIAIAVGWPSLSPTSNSKALDLYNTVNDYVSSNGTGSIGTPQNICTALINFQKLMGPISDGYLTVLNLFLGTPIYMPTGYRCEDCATDAAHGLANALAGTGVYDGVSIAQGFLYLIQQCIQNEYTNSGISPINPTGPVSEQCQGRPNNLQTYWYQSVDNPSPSDIHNSCAPTTIPSACAGASGWHPPYVIWGP